MLKLVLYHLQHIKHFGKCMNTLPCLTAGHETPTYKQKQKKRVFQIKRGFSVGVESFMAGETLMKSSHALSNIYDVFQVIKNKFHHIIMILLLPKFKL